MLIHWYTMGSNHSIGANGRLQPLRSLTRMLLLGLLLGHLLAPVQCSRCTPDSIRRAVLASTADIIAARKAPRQFTISQFSEESLVEEAQTLRWLSYVFEPLRPLCVDTLFSSALTDNFEIALFKTEPECSAANVESCVPIELLASQRVHVSETVDGDRVHPLPANISSFTLEPGTKYLLSQGVWNSSVNPAGHAPAEPANFPDHDGYHPYNDTHDGNFTGPPLDPNDFIPDSSDEIEPTFQSTRAYFTESMVHQNQVHIFKTFGPFLSTNPPGTAYEFDVMLAIGWFNTTIMGAAQLQNHRWLEPKLFTVLPDIGFKYSKKNCKE
eukprot:gb/GECG01001917.1/.p1 GENE.gb/GECG01001917.1/~~gb/GECG01001917.1/.p1  ORF type:complete len:326 (+),score=22.67 gb/GECG01001917.1/:1-978(+)